MILNNSADPLVSTDFNGCPLSSVVAAPTTDVMGSMVKVLAWMTMKSGTQTAWSILPP